jgi:acyl-coenzyme A synthetase/AMP-(fatty) acid ligase
VVLFSSGTTGTPKAILHTWENLARRVRVSPDLEGMCWLTSHSVPTFAGLQVLLHVLSNGGTLVTPPQDPGAAAALARQAGVTHVSGTPSFYRLLLARASAADLRALSLQQITLGGEAADQTVLDALKATFPGARVTQIYASTEMGACFAVHDGLAGLPVEYLDSERGGVRLRIVGGELHVGSPGAMLGYLGDGSTRPPGGLFATGDMVEVRGDRVRFVGRRGSGLNVGGRKADPEEIEAVVREVPGVVAARVSGSPSSLLGQLVRAEVVLGAGVDPAAARHRILAHCRESLRPHMVPRRLEFVQELAGTAGGKLLRRQS